GDYDRVSHLQSELAMPVEAVARLQDRRVCERVDFHDATVSTVVETSVGADRPVNPVDHSHAVTHEAAKTDEVEVERVVEARRGSARDLIRFDREPSALELAHEREQKLIAAAVRRRVELMEDGDVRRGTSRPQPGGLRASPAIGLS